MKTRTKVGLLIGIFLLALGITAIKIAHHRGESFEAGITNLSLGSSYRLDYDQKGYTVCDDGEESFSVNEIDALRIDWLSGAVSVERYDGKELVVRERAAFKLEEDTCLRWKLSGGTLSILPCANRVQNLHEKELTVLVPRALTLDRLDADATSASVRALDLEVSGEICLSSLSGSLRAEDCRCASLTFGSNSGSQHILRTEVRAQVNADALSGSFTAEDLRCESLDVESSSGSQKITSLRCGELRLSSLSGSQRASGLDCREIESHSTSGSVQLAFSSAPGSVYVGATSGSVELCFPKGTGIDLDFDRTSGSLHGDVVRGPIPVDVETTSGSLTIRYSD